MRSNNFFKTSFGRGIAGAIFIATFWEIVPLVFNISDSVFPPFHDVALSIYKNRLLLFQELSLTSIESIGAWLCALFLAGCLAVAMDLWPWFESLSLYPLLAVQNIPKVAIAPLIIIWIGHGLGPIIAIGVLVAFFPIFEGFREGLSKDRTGLRVVFGPLCGNKYTRLSMIKLPEAMPDVLHGSRVGMTFATLGVIVGELVTPDRGLGKLISDGYEMFKYDLQFAAVVAVSLVGLSLYILVVLFEYIPFFARFKYHGSSILKAE